MAGILPTYSDTLAIRRAGKVVYGHGKAAQKLGRLHQWYRSGGTTTPILTPSKLLGTLPFAEAPQPRGDYKVPNGYGKAVWGGFVDNSFVQPGDYLHGPSGTWFLAQADDFAPLLFVKCNTLISAHRERGETILGENAYGGHVDATDSTLFSGWPGSLLQGGQSTPGSTGLPADVTMGGAVILLPRVPTVTLRTSDRLQDGRGANYIVGSIEETALGWRISGTLAAA